MHELNRHYINRLTALWAFSESGLGGIMHAFKIPFTGFFVGGFAIVIITLIAHFSTKRFADILQSTILVMLVKAAASPQSPVMAYLAVAFQGLCGALIFAWGKNAITAALFGALALFESAVQKFITATIIFGKNIWQALDVFMQGIAKELHLNSDFSFSIGLIVSYTAIYTVWGVILGIWANRMPMKMEREAVTLNERMKQFNNTTIEQTTVPKPKQIHWKILSVVFMLLFIVSIFIATHDKQNAAYTIIRTLAALAIIYFFLSPVTKLLFHRWLKNKQSGNRYKIKGIMDALPQLKKLTAPAMHFAKTDVSGWFVYPKFVFNLIVLALYYYEEQP